MSTDPVDAEARMCPLHPDRRLIEAWFERGRPTEYVCESRHHGAFFGLDVRRRHRHEDLSRRVRSEKWQDVVNDD